MYDAGENGIYQMGRDSDGKQGELQKQQKCRQRIWGERRADSQNDPNKQGGRNHNNSRQIKDTAHKVLV
ncbi:MAG TPA: hypothetical protein VIK28_10715 [Sedimentisphaerales bacterium]